MRSARLLALAVIAMVVLAAGAGAQTISSGQAMWDAQHAADSVEQLRADPEMAHLLSTDEDLKKKLQQAYAKLALSRGALQGSGQYREAEAREFAIAAERDFTAVANGARAKWEQARAAAAQAEEEALARSVRAEADSLAAEAKELFDRPGTSEPAELKRRGDLGRALKAYRELPPAASLESLRGVRDRLASASGALSDTLRKPSLTVPGGGATYVAEAPLDAHGHPAPEKLRLAITAFLGGDYSRAADILAVADLGDDHATRIALQVRGAAYFSLYVESGERDRALLDRAVADVRACQRLDPGATPSRSLFSPRYAELFQRH